MQNCLTIPHIWTRKLQVSLTKGVNPVNYMSICAELSDNSAYMAPFLQGRYMPILGSRGIVRQFRTFGHVSRQKKYRVTPLAGVETKYLKNLRFVG